MFYIAQYLKIKDLKLTAILSVIACLCITPVYAADLDGDGYQDEADADIDGDGIPNPVEEAVGLDPLNAADGLLDLDADGWVNVDEYRLGTALNGSLDTPANQIYPHQKVFAADGANQDNFGNGKLSRNSALVFARGDQFGKGTVHEFVLRGGIWHERAQFIIPGVDAADNLKLADYSGNTAVFGASRDDDFGTSSGSAYIYTRSGGTWTQQAKLFPDDGTEFDEFGSSASISGDTVVIGASNSNSAYVFIRTNGIWSQQAKLQGIEVDDNDNFGSSLSLSGDTVVIGANLDYGNVQKTGSAYVFTRSGDSWTQEARLLARDGASGDEFGYSVSLSGNTVVIGARYDEDSGYRSGSAYVFTRKGSQWSQQAKLRANDGQEHDRFAQSVSLSKDTVAISSSDYAYVFKRSAKRWTQQAKLQSADFEAGDYFGTFVALSGDRLIVSATYDDDNGPNSGSSYFYDLDLDDDGLLNGEAP